MMRYWARDGSGPERPGSREEWLALKERAGIHRSVGYIAVGYVSMRCEWVTGRG